MLLWLLEMSKARLWVLIRVWLVVFYLVLDFRKMSRIRDRSRDEDHGLQIDKISLAYVKHFEIGCYLMYDL